MCARYSTVKNVVCNLRILCILPSQLSLFALHTEWECCRSQNPQHALNSALIFFFFFTSHVDGVSKTLSTCIVSKVVESAQKIVQQIPELFEHYGADLLLWCQKCIIKCAKKWRVLAQTHLLCVNLQRLDSKRVQSASTKCQSRNI